MLSGVELPLVVLVQRPTLAAVQHRRPHNCPQKVEDPTTEESLSIRNEPQSLSLRELFSMPNGNNNNVTVKTEVKTEMNNNGREVSAAPISPPPKAHQNGITQSSIQPSPGLNTMMGALTTKTAAQGPSFATHGQILDITAPDSLCAPPTAIPQAYGAETKQLTTTVSLSPPPATRPPVTAIAAPPSQYSLATPILGASAMNNAGKQPVISTTVPPRTASPGTPLTTATAIYPITATPAPPHPASPGTPVSGAVTPTVKHTVISVTVPPRTASPGTPMAGATTATAIYPVTAAPAPPHPAFFGTPATGAVTTALPRTASPGPPMAGVPTKPDVATSGLSVTGNPLTAMNPTMLPTVPVAKAGPTNTQAQAQANKGSSGSESSEDSVETALSISTIPEAERAKYSFLNARDKRVEVSRGTFTKHQEDDTLAMKDLDLYVRYYVRKNTLLNWYMKQRTRIFLPKGLARRRTKPVSSNAVSRDTTSSLPDRKKKKRHKRRKSPLLKAVFRDNKKKKTGIKTPPPAQKA
ncbi:hypothetical protein TELCIR_08904 [Teladorsagia circumcincta]|uniref:Uncharacterized protein n=1 Tax=Teladorsagia circumcincta TaxID=45464 RepID=A0A2G9UGA3_TELCI|nr:hypothetical protein TELCIR_08904 [Teladorsagia circumcincta]